MTHEEEQEILAQVARDLRDRRSPVVAPTLSVIGAFCLPAGFIAWLLAGDWRWTLVGVAMMLGFLISSGAVSNRHK